MTIHSLKLIAILLMAAITTGCSYLGYRSPIDTRQYVAGLRSLQSDGRDDVKACKFYENVAEYVMSARQYDGDDFYRIRSAMSDELDKFQEKGFEKFPNNRQGVEQVVFMVRDMMNVLLRDAGDHEVAFAFGKEIQVNVFSHKHYNICLLSTTLSRSMKVAENMIDKTQADFEGKSEDHYNEKHKKPAVIPKDTKPRSDAVDTANELAAEFAIELLRWYFRM